MNAHAVASRGLVVLLTTTVLSMTADAAFTPSTTLLRATDTFGSNVLVQDDTQPLPVAPLNVDATNTSDTGLSSGHIVGQADFDTPQFTTLNVDWTRVDSSASEDVFISTHLELFYDFSVDVPTDITINYDFTVTTSSTAGSSTRWWAMGVKTNVAGQTFFPVDPSVLRTGNLTSPQEFTGSHTFSVPAGAWEFHVDAGGGASGDFPGTRTIDGQMTIAVVSPGLPGDYNEDGIINAADYVVWRKALANGAMTIPNDPTPGTVDSTDYDYWRAHQGESAGSGSSGSVIEFDSTVPEPTGTRMLFTGLLAFCPRRRPAAS